ncbi:MAG: efflux RND transporter periplasmic adaptor subunit [Faecousia sp.]
MKKRFFAGALSLALLLGTLTGCGNKLPAVYVQSVSQIMGYGAMGGSNACAGVVVAQNEVKVERDESRKVAELRVEVGQTVSAGEVLFVYDTDEIQLTIDRAKLEIEQMKNTVKDYTEQITQLEKEKKSVPESEKLSYTVRIQSLEADKKETEYNIAVKERELAELQANAGSGAVTAPIDGKIKAINENGGYDDMTGQPLPYITMIQDGAYRVKGKVNELNLSEFYVGQIVTIRSRADETMTWTGMIAEIDTAPETNNNDGMYYYGYGVSDEMTSTSSYPFYVDLDTVDDLLLGQHVFIESGGGLTETLEGVSLYADYVLGSEEEGYYVWAANADNEIEKRAVTVRSFDEMLYCYVITEGLTAEDRIAFPDDSIQEGAPVTDTMPENPDSEAPLDFEVIDDGYVDDGFVDNGFIDDGFVDEGFVDDGFDSFPEGTDDISGGMTDAG